MKPNDRSLLLKLNEKVFIRRIDWERELTTGPATGTVPRTMMIRMLLLEALDAREAGRTMPQHRPTKPRPSTSRRGRTSRRSA
jgi:hypothetical protein